MIQWTMRLFVALCFKQPKHGNPIHCDRPQPPYEELGILGISKEYRGIAMNSRGCDFSISTPDNSVFRHHKGCQEVSK